MVETEAFKKDDPDSLEHEMKWLEEKVPKGTTLYIEIFRTIKPANFDQWSQMIRNYISCLPQPQKKTLPQMVKANVGGLHIVDGGGGQPAGGTVQNCAQFRLSKR